MVDFLVNEAEKSMVPIEVGNEDDKVIKIYRSPEGCSAVEIKDGEIITFFYGMEKVKQELLTFSPKMLRRAYNLIQKEVERYNSARRRLKTVAQRIASGECLKKLERAIDVMAVSTRYVGNRNRVYTSTDIYYYLTEFSGRFVLEKVERNGYLVIFYEIDEKKFLEEMRDSEIAFNI